MIGLILASLLGVARADDPPAPLLTARPARAGWVQRGLRGQATRPLTLAEALEGRQATLEGDGALLGCAGEPLAVDVLSADLDRAQAALSQGELREASVLLRGSAHDMTCADRILEAPRLAELYAARGRVSRAMGQEQAAAADLRAAVALDPHLDAATWTEAERAALGAARSAPREPDRTLRLPGASGRLWVDGRPTQASGELLLSAGPHLLQIGERAPRSYLLSVGPTGDARLVLPGLIDDRALRRVPRGADGQADLLALARAAFPDGERVIVQEGSHVWSAGSDSLERLPVHPPGRAMAASGTGALVAGVTGSLLSYTLGHRLYATCDATRGEDDFCAANEQRYALYRQILLPGSEGLAGVGVVMLGTGMLRHGLLSRPVPVEATP